MKAIIETIPHEQQVYETCGDWRFENGSGLPMTQKAAMQNIDNNDSVLRIRVSKLGDYRYEMLIAVHELVETLMCVHDGVQVEDVDAFDKAFEAARDDGNEDEPGDDPKAPYVRQHCVATAVERLLCSELGCNWDKYCRLILALPKIPAKE